MRHESQLCAGDKTRKTDRYRAGDFSADQKKKDETARTNIRARPSRSERCLTLLIAWNAEILQRLYRTHRDIRTPGFLLLIETESPLSLTRLGAYREDQRWSCAGELIRIHLSVLTVPLKWIVSETRGGGIKAAFVGLALINRAAFPFPLVLDGVGQLPRRTFAFVVESGKQRIF